MFLPNRVRTQVRTERRQIHRLHLSYIAEGRDVVVRGVNFQACPYCDGYQPQGIAQVVNHIQTFGFGLDSIAAIPNHVCIVAVVPSAISRCQLLRNN